MQVFVQDPNNISVDVDPAINNIVIEVNQGRQGRGIENITYTEVSGQYFLIVTYTDGTTETLGPLVVTGGAAFLLGGTAGAIPYQSAPNTTTFLPIGTANQVVVAGASAPQYTSNLTGLTVNNTPVGNTTPSTGAFTNLSASGTFALTGDQVQISEGGTGQTTANAAFNALAPSQTGNAGKYLKTDGTNSAWDQLDISTADITGVLAITNGGTGASTAPGARANLSAAVLGTNNDITSMTGVTGGISSPDFVQFDTTATEANAVGKVYWDAAQGTLDVGLLGGNVVTRIGQTLVAYVTNAEAVTITKGQVVYLFGAQGDRATVKLAYNTSDATSAKTFGVVAENIGPNQTGFVMCQGVLEGLNLGAFTAGDTLYLGATPGSLTATKPAAPNHLVYVGLVERANAGNGQLYVKVQNGYELDEIHDVQIINPQNGQTIIYDATTSLWKNANLTAGSGISVTNGAASITVSNTGVLSFSGGTTGLTPATSTTGVVTLDGTLNLAHGGTGATTAPGARTNLGLGTISTQDANNVSITGGTITGITDLAVADGGTGASNAPDARTNLGAAASATTITAGTGLTGGGDLSANRTISIANTTVVSGSYGSASDTLTATVNQQGQLTALASTPIAIANTQVSGLGTLSTQNANSVAITGGSINGTTVGAATPSTGAFTSVAMTSGTVTTTPASATDIANKQYVDTLISSGITYHAPVKYEVPNSTGNLNATYNNGTAGVGATLTNAGTLAAFTPDGVVAQAGDRILIYNQTNAFENGVYVVTTVGSGSVAWVLTRASDADTYALKSPNSLGEGDAFFIQSGNTGAGETYVCNTSGTITFGTTPITFVQVSASQIYSAGTGLTLSGTQFSITNTAVTPTSYGSASSVGTFTVNQQGQLTAAASVPIAITNTQVSGLGTMSTQNATNVAITGGSITGINDLAVADGGTGASDAATARTNLGAAASATTISAGTGLSGGGDLSANRTISLANTTVTAASYGSASSVGTFTVNAQGQLTAAASTPIAITNTQVSGLGTMSTQNANSVAITGGSIDGATIGGTTRAAGSFTTLTLTNALGIANGGTGQTTANAAFNALAPSQTGNAGKYLTTDGTNTSWATNPLGTVTSVDVSGGTTGLTTSGGPITSSGTITLGGTLATTNGGTGLTSFTANRVFYASSTSAIGQSANLTFDGTTLTANALTTSSTVTINGGTANGVAYLNGSKVLTTGSAFVFDGSSVGIGINNPAYPLHVVRDPAAGAIAAFRGSSTAANSRTIIVGNSSGDVVAAADTNGNGIIFSDTSKTLAFGTNGSTTARLLLDTSGNAGLGVTPSAWGGGTKAIDIGSRSAIYSGGAGQPIIANNFYFNGTNNIYKASAAATAYQQLGGAHEWYTAASGTAGNAISFSQVMTLDASGNWKVGTTSFGTRAAIAGTNTAVNTTVSGANTGMLFLYDTSAAANAGPEILMGSSYDGTNSVVGTSIKSYKVPGSGSGSDQYNHGLIFKTSNFTSGLAERLRIDSSGNAGLGVTPSAWASGARAIQILPFVSVSCQSNGNANFGFNFYEGGTNTFNYVTTDEACRFSALTTGGFGWFTAPSGTAGAAISFTQAMTLTAAGDLGVGTTSPGYRLEISSGATDANTLLNSTNANGAHLRFAASGTVKSYIGGAPGFLGSGTADDLGIRAVGSILFATNGSSVDMNLDTAGNLGLGVAPSFNSGYMGMQINGGSNGSVLHLTNSTTGTTASDGFDLIVLQGGTDAYVWQRESASLIFGTAQTERSRITANGQFLIGSSSAAASLPSGALQVGSGFGGLTAGTVATSILTSGALEFNLDGVAGTQRHGRIRGTAGNGQGGVYGGGLAFEYFYYNGTTYVWGDAVNIDSGGNVGIGTASPATALNVVGASTAKARFNVSGYAGLEIGQNADFTSEINQRSGSALLFKTSDTERARITSSGQLLAGTTANPTGTTVISDRGYSATGNTSLVQTRTGNYNGNVTNLVLFTRGNSSNQTWAFVTITTIYGTPSVIVSRTVVMVRGDMTYSIISQVGDSGSNGYGAISFSVNGNEFRVSNSNTSIYFSIECELGSPNYTNGYGWSATWGSGW